MRNITRNIVWSYVALLAVTAVAIALTVLFFSHSYQQTVILVKKQILAQQAIACRQVAGSVEDNIGTMVDELHTLSRSPALRKFDLDRARRDMEHSFLHVKDLFVNDIAFLDAQGVLTTSLNSPQLVGKDFSWREYYGEVRARATAIPAFELITFKGINKGEKGVLVAMPVFEESGTFAGAAIFVVEVAGLLSALLPAPSPDNLTWVSTREGTVLHHPSLPHGASISDPGTENAALSSFLKRLVETGDVKGEYTSDWQGRVVAAGSSVQVGRETWLVVTESDEGQIRELIGGYQREHVGGAVAALMFLTCCASAVLWLLQRSRFSIELEMSERRKVEERLSLREETYRALLDGSPS